MAFELRHIDDLAEEVGGLTKARKLLKDAGINVVGGFYDHGAVQALFAEPSESNIGARKKNKWTIAETDGIGAIKHVLDRVDLDIVRHLYHSTNYLTVRNAKGRRRHLKVYSTAYMQVRSERASFTLTGYLSPDAPNYYLLVCYDGPIAWAVKRRELVEIDKVIRKQGFYNDLGGWSQSQRNGEHPHGQIQARLGAVHVEWLLADKRRLDL